MNTLYYRIAGLPFSLQLLHADVFLRTLSSFAPFRSPNDVPLQECIFNLQEAEDDISAPPQGKFIGTFDGGDATFSIHLLDDGGYIININNRLGLPNGQLHSSADFSECRLKLKSAGNDSLYAWCLNNALMIAFAFAGARHSALLMHASVIVNNAHGFLFLGKSGTGKSTHSQLWLNHIPHSRLLNDDNPVVRLDKVQNRAIVYGSPWSGKTPCYLNQHAVIAAFVRLEQAPQNSIHRHSAVEAFASILSACSSMMWDQPSYHAICRTIAGIVSITPSFRLKCLPHQSAAELCYRQTWKG